MAAIKNFGHFWAERNVHWNLGGKSTKGHLKGYPRRGAQKLVIDFRSQIGIYVLFAPDREVIYIGQAGRGTRKKLFGRLKDHKRDHLRERWSHFSWFCLCEIDEEKQMPKPFVPGLPEKPSEILDEVESILIHLFEPRLNMQRARWIATKDFIQYVSEEDIAVESDDE